MSKYTIDIEAERVFLLSDGKTIPQVNQSYHSLRRYIKVGCVNQTTGEVVCLPSAILPGGMGTSIEAYQWFIRELNGQNG